MKYYVLSDIHGFLSETKDELNRRSFFDSTDNVLILCGDALDRGAEAKETVKFLLELKNENRLIYVRGNHEDLIVQMAEQISEGNIYDVVSGRLSHHISNGTFDTALQLTDTDEISACRYPYAFLSKIVNSPYFKELLPSAVDCFELGEYIFVHGYLPCNTRDNRYFSYMKNWREADTSAWQRARWYNGMEFALKHKITEEGKTVVCGHWHTSYGHRLVGKTKSEFGNDADFSPFISDGIIALDACTAHSGRVNCMVLEGDSYGI